MLPAPTAEGVVLLGLLAVLTEGKPGKCSRLTNGILRQLGPDEPRRVRELREAIPSMKQAKLAARAVLVARCVVCHCRSRCQAPVVMD
jgi:hypothetical protein